MHTVTPVYKVAGETPLETIKRFRLSFPEYNSQTISYAGRLDPLAEGILLLLIGEANKDRKQYEHLQKTYRFTLLLGIDTDTYDVMGKITAVFPTEIQLQENILTDSLLQFVGIRNQPYPPYSSRTVRGKPLYWWARHNKLDEITIPQRKVEILSLEKVFDGRIEKDTLLARIQATLNGVKGNFRQEEIAMLWEKELSVTQVRSFPIATCTVTCTSGTYVRSLAHELGKTLKTGGLALQIMRTKVGAYELNSTIRI
jgi:tRNA pseudouridine55 synthase